MPLQLWFFLPIIPFTTLCPFTSLKNGCKYIQFVFCNIPELKLGYPHHFLDYQTIPDPRRKKNKKKKKHFSWEGNKTPTHFHNNNYKPQREDDGFAWIIEFWCVRGGCDYANKDEDLFYNKFYRISKC